MKTEKYSAILGNTVGYHELGDLTSTRPLATLPFDGKYRLMDFQLSNLINSGIRNVYGIFQEQTVRSVFDHIRSAQEWGLNTLLSNFFIGFYDNQAEDQHADKSYYQQLLTFLKRSGSDQTVFMTCDVLCNIDLEQVINVHEEAGKNLTVVYKKMARRQISKANHILTVDEKDQVVASDAFTGESASEELEKMSTGIYVAKTEWLIAQMEAEMEAEQPRKLRYLLGELIVPEQASAYEYTGYLSNIHDIPSYFEANMDMLDPQKFMTLLHSKQKIYTKVKNEESTYFSDKSHVINSQFASGSVIHGEVIHSIVSRKCCIEESTSIAETILFPNVTIGQNVKIDYAIIDKDAVIKDGITIRGTVDMPVVIKKGQVVTEDIVL